MRRPWLLLGLILSGDSGPLAGQSVQPATPCPPAAVADTTWARFSFIGLQLSLFLPRYLRAERFAVLERIARQVRADRIPSQLPDSSQLVAAWHKRAKAPESVGKVFLFTTRTSALPSGRPCSFTIAGQPARVYRHVLSGSAGTPNEYWLEAYWPGFVLAVGGTSLAAYDLAFTLLTGIATVP